MRSRQVDDLDRLAEADRPARQLPGSRAQHLVFRHVPTGPRPSSSRPFEMWSTVGRLPWPAGQGGGRVCWLTNTPTRIRCGPGGQPGQERPGFVVEAARVCSAGRSGRSPRRCRSRAPRTGCQRSTSVGPGQVLVGADPEAHVTCRLCESHRKRGRRRGAGPGDWFTGAVYIDTVAAPADGSRAGRGSVHFAPGARTAWHTHPNGQTIWVTEGVGLCQRAGGPIEVIRPGDRVFFEPGENHWHGAAPTRLHDPHRDAAGRREATPSTWGDHVSDERVRGGAADRGGGELMRATVMYGAGDVRIENVPDPRSSSRPTR